MSGHQEQVRRELSAYLDGELPPEEAERLARWLRSDPLLSRELSALRAVREMLKEKRISAIIPGVNIPEQLEENVKGSYERRTALSPEQERRVLGRFTRNFYANLTPEYDWLRSWETV